MRLAVPQRAQRPSSRRRRIASGTYNGAKMGGILLQVRRRRGSFVPGSVPGFARHEEGTMSRLLLCAALGAACCAAPSLGDDKERPCKVMGQITKVGADHFVVKDRGGKLHHVCCSKE